MDFKLTLRQAIRVCAMSIVSVAFVFGLSAPVSADECKNRGDLDSRFCDADGDLVADMPTDASKWLDPDTLIFSYTPVEDPSVYENVFTEFMDYLSKATGKKVKWYGAESYAAQVEAMRSGRLHVAGISTGPTVFGVNLAGYVPIAIMGKHDGRFGYKLQLITHKSSDITKVSDMKGRNIAHVTPSSNSGNQAPRALFKSLGVEPDKDYEVKYSGKHDNSIMGVANMDYDAAPIASSVLDRMVEKGVVNRDDLRVIWESKLFPTTSYGFAHNLHPDLQRQVTYAFLSFDWAGTALHKEFGSKSDRFISISFKDHWSDIRTIQKMNGTVYNEAALQGMKVKKKK
ncbi:MAG: phosphate/phosphite/phosphonate ABC transporter substrate-binding protein [Rhodospirillaceae bacterium]|jgi:phosphonate transport system substrate-binding protein|nr:phosphate/phosphite/phosphonate ABC transporter substrate-binding protein [Rhodospirillaceae bacterium]MBT5245619.1 phosphate/phosphite/phosphonate ABC transporter substrate-binding protein [Rhodospirillaceae bacterium]MBT5561133.1 phosphate/phosphite/phosphonate ABC transporter substrate-binding protein [Rhodospirillaceae bacterium]MBT6242829.1 phosphate/phosphite/phosphonate ABC transporter substrate-binding protein [Rhodospirillaceae bacterium]MBT7138778.1 phosphate/phosphite/phosphonate 